jgi:phosphatidate cytidylyltransferase
LTAVIALPLLIIFVLKTPPALFAGLIVLCCFLGLLEYYRMALPGRKHLGTALAGVGAFFPLLFHYGSAVQIPAFLTAATLGSALLYLFSINDLKTSASEFALTLSGVLYVPLLLGHLVLLRNLPHGIQWIFLLLLLVMSGDTGAYYMGRSLGRRKLYPLVSPNKSVEGAVGGLAGSTLGPS